MIPAKRKEQGGASAHSKHSQPSLISNATRRPQTRIISTCFTT